MAIYDNITIEKGMYKNGSKSLTEVLETIDPSRNYEGTSLEGLDAFGRQLKRFDIKVSGANSDCIEKFFQTSNSAALFPEYVRRAVKQGVEQVDDVCEIVASITNIDGMDYRSIASIPSDDAESSESQTSWTPMPKTSVKTQDNLVKLRKRGRMLVSSYEALRFQRLDLFTVTLNQIGAYIRRSQFKDAIDVLLNGDGNDNGCEKVVVNEGKKGLEYTDLLKLWEELSPYELNVIISPTSGMKDILSIPEIKEANAGLGFHRFGKTITPLGANLIHAPSMASGNIIGLDKTCALEMVQAGDVVVDYEKLIDRQLESASIYSVAGFAKIFKNASKALTY